MPDNASECIRSSSSSEQQRKSNQQGLEENSFLALQKDALVSTEPISRTKNYLQSFGPVFETPIADSKDSTTLGRVASGFAELIVQVPGACASQVLDDLNNRPGEVGIKAGTGGLIGLGATVLLRRSPFITQALLGLTAAAEGARLTYGAAGYAYNLGDADTPAQYRGVVDSGIKAFGREGATMLEALSGLAAGSAMAYKFTPKIETLNKLSFQVCQKVDYMARCAPPDYVHWIGPGTKKLSATLRSSTGNLDVKTVTDILAKAHPWRGVEECRFLRLTDMRLSRAYSGTPKQTVLAGGDHPHAKVSFHTHPPDYQLIKPGLKSDTVPSTSIPSQPDLHNTSTPFGLINSGSRSTIFMNGRYDFYRNLPRPGETLPEVALPMRALMFDREHKVAAIIDGAYSFYPSTVTGGPLIGRAEFLDYNKTLARLADWDMKWSSLKEIPKLSQPPKDYHLFPKMSKDGHFSWENGTEAPR